MLARWQKTQFSGEIQLAITGTAKVWIELLLGDAGSGKEDKVFQVNSCPPWRPGEACAKESKKH